MSISMRKKWSPNNGFDMLILSAAYAIHLETYGFNMVKLPQVTSRAFADGSRLKMTENCCWFHGHPISQCRSY